VRDRGGDARGYDRRMRPTLLPVLCGVAAAGAALTAGCRADPPAPPPPAAVAVLVPPLRDAEVGEVLRMRRGDEEWTWRVVSATPDEVEVEYGRSKGDAHAATERQRWNRNGFGVRPGYVITEYRRDRIEVAGREWTCWAVRAHSPDDAIWYWITEELPVAGFLRAAPDERGRPLLGVAIDVVPEGSSFPPR
jgi:hypothetical protein